MCKYKISMIGRWTGSPMTGNSVLEITSAWTDIQYCISIQNGETECQHSGGQSSRGILHL